jgi:LPXTG-motif cell wall-anchored protein
VLGKHITTSTTPAPVLLGKTPNQPGALPFTGSNPIGYMLIAGLLLVTGGGLLLIGRKKASE